MAVSCVISGMSSFTSEGRCAHRCSTVACPGCCGRHQAWRRFSPVLDVDAASVHGGQLVVGERLNVQVVCCALWADVCDLYDHRHCVGARYAAPSKGSGVQALDLKALPARGLGAVSAPGRDIPSFKLKASGKRGSTHAYDLGAPPAQHTEHAGCSWTSCRSLPRAVYAQLYLFEII